MSYIILRKDYYLWKSGNNNSINLPGNLMRPHSSVTKYKLCFITQIQLYQRSFKKVRSEKDKCIN
jgi:hypothetical protein